ncbi:NAD(P)H-dependent flavin oxidoreductase [Hamadaea tsunoensis]|uniref:NAD(P)H-dependent flavin oxidoreductase n=1 Tax=Hamadaea tsunoensis TaxID=53368 RepID=UPI0003FC101E|nr:nitronate monooxygenase [Hamadaea tsunoensis]
MDTLHTRFTEAYGLRTPIAQAGMAFVGMTPALAVAVSNAGALGSLGVGLMPAPALADTIGAIQRNTPHPFNVNFITPLTDDAQIDAVCAAAPAVASFHWGHPKSAWIERLHAAGVRVFEQVGSVETAIAAADGGVDVIVAQGEEAGGHNYGTLPTFALVPLVVDAVAPVLVLASGGVADGRGLAAALMLGADGVWVGTRFVATTESLAHDGYKARLVAADATGTTRTGLFGPDMPQFNPMRVLRNRVVREWADRTGEIPADTSDLPVIGRTQLGGFLGGPDVLEMHKFSNIVPMAGLTTGDLEEMALLSGQGVGLVDAVRPAAEVIAELTEQAITMLGRYRR